MKQETTKQQPLAFQILSTGLMEVSQQSIRSDAATISAKLKLEARTVRPYLKGRVLDLETGKKILIELKSLIKEREASVKKLVTIEAWQATIIPNLDT